MEDAQATAKWANRVLRPLTSICRRIAKHKETLSMITTESKPQETAGCSDVPTLESDNKPASRQNHSGSDADPDENDPAWIPGKKPERRRPRHKYSSKTEESRGKKRNRLSVYSPEAPRTLPGAIEVATPLITGRRWEMPSSAQLERPAGHVNPNIQTSQPQVFRDRYSLHKSPWHELLNQSGDPGFADIAHNLDRVFQNFLCNTMISIKEAKPLSGNCRRGARSLLSMVARSLPKFIASEQDAQDALDEDGNEDMCDVYFTELEAFYAPYGAGWKPLREAVRAQGIYLVSTLIQNHWITESIACALIEKCRSFAPEESDSLLSTVLSMRKKHLYPQALRPVVDHDPSDPIRLLRKYAHHGVASRSFVFDELAKLLLRGVLPPEWMGTKLWTSWMTRATISLSREDEDCPAATRLIEAVILSASGVRPVSDAQSSLSKHPPKEKTARARATRVASTTTWEISNLARPCPLQVEDALSNHVISLMAALCGMHISRSRASDDSDCLDGTKASYVTSYLQIALQRELSSNYVAQRVHNTPHQFLRRGCILLATSLVKCNDKILLNDNHYVMTSSASVDECAEIIATHSDMVRELALFVHQAFRCLKKRTPDATEQTSVEIRDMISQLARVADAPALSALLGRVAAEAAMEFAEATGDPDDHMWAVDVQEVAVAKQHQAETAQMSLEEPEQSSQSTGLFRWEDSIGEWVASTPVTKGKPILVQKAERPMRMLSSPVPSIASSTDTDSSSPESDRFQDYVSILTSSPPQMATKQTFEDTDVSSIRPRKRQRPTPVVAVDRGGCNPEKRFSTAPKFNSTVEPVTRRGILRERSTNLTRRMTPAAQQARKIEVVIINHKESSSRQPIVRPSLERAAKQVHRTVERRRSTRRIVEPPAPRQTLIQNYQDDDSDDELSFF
ncbi:Eukaryotic translation initiation factor 3 subunit CLU1/TIF31 [Penicillium digitatum]|uniref:Uncharacterized protein n=3 Tax=Penicillium digitatum TaxID=36651 RepID=K9FKA1_PEND2|nr:hypothetical protein PDIP_74780 [Penicillium digitatum Pd1]EKV07236.1 hypothetical protein PDIP_74780 [Penicillium digitatum Pd1]EKV08682.1 hypothetical protein PDIG_65460 [Penicillium digitatum PHI26]QQK41115.1 Eukaryotic translation initiation factor 3 subunit CLU1/TIF31 [Penicillium digitatum]